MTSRRGSLLPDLLILIGLLLIPAGVALFHTGAAAVVGGLELVYIGGLMARRS